MRAQWLYYCVLRVVVIISGFQADDQCFPSLVEDVCDPFLHSSSNYCRTVVYYSRTHDHYRTSGRTLTLVINPTHPSFGNVLIGIINYAELARRLGFAFLINSTNSVFDVLLEENLIDYKYKYFNFHDSLKNLISFGALRPLQTQKGKYNIYFRSAIISGVDESDNLNISKLNQAFLGLKNDESLRYDCWLRALFKKSSKFKIYIDNQLFLSANTKPSHHTATINLFYVDFPKQLPIESTGGSVCAELPRLLKSYSSSGGARVLFWGDSIDYYACSKAIQNDHIELSFVDASNTSYLLQNKYRNIQDRKNWAQSIAYLLRILISLKSQYQLYPYRGDRDLKKQSPSAFKLFKILRKCWKDALGVLTFKVCRSEYAEALPISRHSQFLADSFPIFGTYPVNLDRSCFNPVWCSFQVSSCPQFT